MISKQQDMALKLAMQALLGTLWPCSASQSAVTDVHARQPDQATSPGWQGAAAGHFVKIVMSLPQLLSGMPSQVRTQLTSLRAFEAIMSALNAAAEQHSHAGQTHHGQSNSASHTLCSAFCDRCHPWYPAKAPICGQSAGPAWMVQRIE